MRNEPLVEITQIKGTSDTHPALSVDDEWANFEIVPFKLGAGFNKSQPHGSYAPRGVAERPALPRPHRRQPVPLRLRRLERHPQRRRALRRVAVRRQGGGLHERPGRPRVRARAARRPRPAVPGTGREPVRGGARVPHARPAARPSRDRPPLLQRIGPGGHLGAGEHPGGAVRRHAAQGDLRHERPAHHRAVRGRGDPRGRAGRPLPRHPRRRRGAGRGPRAARRGDAAVPRLGHGGPRQRAAAAAADRQGLGRRRLAEGAGVRRRVLGRPWPSTRTHTAAPTTARQ